MHGADTPAGNRRNTHISGRRIRSVRWSRLIALVGCFLIFACGLGVSFGCGRGGALRKMFVGKPKPDKQASTSGERTDGGRLFSRRDREKPPEGEDIWAIRVASFSGRDHAMQGEACAEQLGMVEGLDPELVEVRALSGESVVYYGRYWRDYSSGEGVLRPDPRAEIELIRDLSMIATDDFGSPRTVFPFQFATIEELPAVRRATPETTIDAPAARPSWELTSAPGTYSLQVAVFYNTETMRERKFAAEEYCRLLRAEGEEAYFLHGPANSSVYIGSFPEEAIQDVRDSDPMTGAVKVSRRIVDPRLLDLQRRYPHNLHNGFTIHDVRRDPSTGERVRDPHPSFTVRIPRSGEDWSDPMSGW